MIRQLDIFNFFEFLRFFIFLFQGTLSFASIIFPSAGATELGSGQRDQQVKMQIHIFNTSIYF